MNYNQNLFSSELTCKIETALSQFLLQKTPAKLLNDAMRYSSLAGGKRIRPLLTIAAGRLNNANLDALLQVGCAIELIHCYSLIHDDLPALDDDDLRRGKATCHIKFDEATAILAGDALHSLAFEILSDSQLLLSFEVKIKIINLLAKLIGASGMVGGQAIDLASTGCKLELAQLRQMHLLKTGGLIKAAILCGYLCGNDFNQQVFLSLTKIADNLGLLFQITDDILDTTINTATLGKTANKDLLNDKATYVSLLGLTQAREYASLAYQEIINDLNCFNHNIHLAQLVHSIYTRNN